MASQPPMRRISGVSNASSGGFRESMEEQAGRGTQQVQITTIPGDSKSEESGINLEIFLERRDDGLYP
jgi:hypothetical protein